jgi:hypothetical protein
VLAALVLIVVLIEVTPAIVFIDGAATRAIVALVVALALLIISAAVRRGESDHLAKVVTPVLLLLAIPALWMFVQLLPMPLRWSHAIWASAAEALNRSAFGHISIDLGATLIGLIRFLTAAGILVGATAVTIDRTRAEWMLYWLTGASAFFSAMLIAHSLFGLFPLAGLRALSALNAASALGALLAAATTIRAIERYETRRNKAKMTRAKFTWSLTASLSAFAICWLALILAAPPQVTFAAGCGFAAVVLVVIVRRFALGPIVGVALAAVTIVAAIAVAGGRSNTGGGPTLGFAAPSPPPSTVSTVERMIADNPFGAGAGTFKALLPIYRGADDAALPDEAPTMAAQLAIEMGLVALWTFVLLMMIATGLLLRGALSRGRDSFYATAAAGCAITLTVEAFVDASLLATTIVILATAFLGLGLAQSVSRST